MKFLRNKKIGLAALVVVILVVLLIPQLTKANIIVGAVDLSAGISILALAPVLVPLGVLLYAAMYISGWLIAFMGFLVNQVIILGNGILTQPAVLSGWGTMLNITNLGFVLGIIIIAFATIFRLESYALKQTLSKLIVAALLVNFSLVIAGGFISISKITTDVFYNEMIKDGESMKDVLGTLAQPQEVTAPLDKSLLGQAWDATKSVLSLFTATGQLNFVVGLVFQLVMNFIILLTFATLIVMLLVRVIALIFLLILSPIVWLLWIFPATKKYWQQWWQEFIRWNFFAPAIMFFMYLAVLTRNKLPKITPEMKELTGIGGNLGIFFNNIWESIMNNIVIMSILIGGIYVANKFGIAGGDIGINLAQKAGKGVGAWAGRKGLSGARRAGSGIFGSEPMRKFGTKLQTMGSQSGWFGKRAVSLLGVNKLGNAMNKVGVQQGEAAVKDVEKKYGHLSDMELGKRMHQFTAPERQYALQRMAKNGTLGMVTGGAGQYVNKDEKERWARRGGDKNWGDLTKAYGGDENTEVAIKNADMGRVAIASANLSKAKTGIGKMEARAEFELSGGKAIQEAMTKFAAGLSKQDKLKLDLSNLSDWDNGKNNPHGVKTENEHNAIRRMQVENTLDNDPSVISSYNSKLKGNSLINTNNIVSDRVNFIDDSLAQASPMIKDKNNNNVKWHDSSNVDKVRAVQKDPALQNILKALLKVERKESMSAAHLVSKFDKILDLNKHLAGFLSEDYGRGGGGASESSTPSPKS